MNNVGDGVDLGFMGSFSKYLGRSARGVMVVVVERKVYKEKALERCRHTQSFACALLSLIVGAARPIANTNANARRITSGKSQKKRPIICSMKA